MEIEMRKLLRKKLYEALDDYAMEVSLEKHEKIDRIIDDLCEYVLFHSRRHPLYRRDRIQMERIESKLDHVIENHQNSKCRFAEQDGNGYLQLMTEVGANGRSKAIQHLSEKLAGTVSLTICDPYFLKKSKDLTPAQTAMEFIEILPKSLRAIELYTKPNIRDKDLAECINDELRERDIKLILRKTEEIHDRVWIKDYSEAFIVGTSFNGLGNKCAFILDLPDEDKKKFLFSLNQISTNMPKSKSA